MPILTATQNNALLKKRDVQSTELSPGEFISIDKGVKIPAVVLPHFGQTLRIVLAGNVSKYGLKTGETYFIYIPQWSMPGGFLQSPVSVAPLSIQLSVPYFAQCDTEYEGFRECNAHSNAMLCAFLLGKEYFDRAKAAGYVDQPELLYIKIQQRIGDTTDHNVQSEALEFFGIESEWKTDINPNFLHRYLSAGYPMPIGTKYKGSGHIVICIGIDAKGNYLINDPNGKRNGSTDSYFCNSTNAGREGANDIYSPNVMSEVFWDLGVNSGYGRVVKSINGKKTGF